MFECKYCKVRVKVLDSSGCEQCVCVYPDNFTKWNSRKQAVYDKTGGKCWLCNQPLSKQDFTFDHVIPKSKGGKDGIHNLMPAHKRCNVKRGNVTI